jgi:hypothetical protein
MSYRIKTVHIVKYAPKYTQFIFIPFILYPKYTITLTTNQSWSDMSRIEMVDLFSGYQYRQFEQLPLGILPFD